jgi:hypothetical protein
MTAASLPASSASATAIELGKTLSGTRQGPSLYWEGGKRASSLGGEGILLRKDPRPSGEEEAYERRNLPLPGGRSIREKARDVSRESKWPGTWRAYPVRGSPVFARECAWRTRGGSPLPWTCRRHHYRGRRGNDRQDRLVESHRRSAPSGVKDSMVHSPVGLHHRPKSRDICHACNLAIVVSP